MAIKLIDTSTKNQIKLRGLIRFKERDYTIPDRLNQLIPEQTNRKSSSSMLQAAPNSRHIAGNILQVSARNIKQSISSSKYRRVLVATFLIVAPLLNFNLCHCDTQLPENNNNKQQSSYLPSQSTINTKDRPSIAAATSAIKNHPATNIQKEHLLAKLSNSIELQHFKLKPPRALIHERPSKHDSGDEDVRLGVSFNFATSAKSKGSSSRAAANKVDDSMQQIVRMHELHAQHNNHQSSERKQPKDVAAEQQLSSKRWRDISQGPIREMAAVLMKPNKLVAQAMSYISPLAGTKLASESSLVANQKHQAHNDGGGKPLSTQVTGEKSNLLGGLHSFAGRSHNTNQPTTTSTPSSSSSSIKGLWPLGKKLLLRPFATSSPQMSSLIGPYNKDNEHSTRPTTIFESGNFHGNLNSNDKSRATASHKQSSDPLADLLADSSDFSAVLAPVAGLLAQFPPVKQPAVTPSYSSVFDEPARKFTSVSTATSEISPASADTPKSHEAVGSVTQSTATKTSNKKKNSANNNHKAQSYLKNSFKDLITNSRLSPILSSGATLSTAPSILEKKSHTKPRGPKRDGGSNGSVGVGQQQQQQQDLDNRKRIFDDLYRYIYMIGTGVRNKKDPLEALGSATSPSQTNSNALSNNHQKGVFSQRSINQLIAANHNQMLNYARKFRSLLITGPMSKAKPRGVMWDMATDPSLAVTVFHLLERASVALPLGFLLMPIVRMIRHPLQGLDFNRFLPARASHRSVDYEELAKRLDVVDKMLSRALRQTHRESFISK